MTPDKTSAPQDSPFHAGELAIQQQAGTREDADAIGRRIIRDHLLEQHRLFFSQLPFQLVGSTDEGGQPWASILVGAPGFMRAPDAHTLRVDAKPLPGDKLAAHIVSGARLGMLGIELPTRRRSRLNATITGTDAEGFSVRVDPHCIC